MVENTILLVMQIVNQDADELEIISSWDDQTSNCYLGWPK